MLRIPVLDGWRATSILLVLACHLLPLGPKSLQLNAMAGAMGMALFFTLSGFLIVSFLSNGMSVSDFLVRRIARIVPLAWTAVLVLVLWRHPDPITAYRNFGFVANLPPASLMHGGEHLWSLGVEMQFYVLAALICLTFGRKGLIVIPLLCVSVTLLRVYHGAYISIVTWERIDEILAGGTLALMHERLVKFPLWPLGIALALSSHPAFGWMQYFRPYAAMLLVGVSIQNPPKILLTKTMAYIAEISYALYVIHGILSASWLGEGSHKYLKRPLLLLATFTLAHVSTRYFEEPIMRRAKSRKRNRAVIVPVNVASTRRAQSLVVDLHSSHTP